MDNGNLEQQIIGHWLLVQWPNINWKALSSNFSSHCWQNKVNKKNCPITYHANCLTALKAKEHAIINILNHCHDDFNSYESSKLFEFDRSQSNQVSKRDLTYSSKYKNTHNQMIYGYTIYALPFFAFVLIMKRKHRVRWMCRAGGVKINQFQYWR